MECVHSPQFVFQIFLYFFYLEGWLVFAMPINVVKHLCWARGFTVHDNEKCIQYVAINVLKRYIYNSKEIIIHRLDMYTYILHRIIYKVKNCFSLDWKIL